MLRLPKLFQNGCVLQQGNGCRIWGWCAPGEEVQVSLGIPDGPKKEARAAADTDGLFELTLQTPPAGGPYLMRVKNAGGEELTLREVYVGEVFVCSGQSNMELPMSRVCERFPEEFRNGGAPNVHEYKVTEYRDFCGPLEDHVQAEWRACAGAKLPEVSALAYFFGKELSAQKKLPVGILNLSLGGTPAEAWMSREGLREWPEALKLADTYKDDDFCRKLTERETQAEADWQREIARQEAESASAPWQPAVLPGQLRDWGPEDFCGCIYLRKRFSVPSACLDRDGLLRFGTLVDSDTIYINGTCVGETGYRYPPRRYLVPAGLLREGENEIVIRLVCRSGEGRSTVGQPLEIVWENDCTGGSAGGSSDESTDVRTDMLSAAHAGGPESSEGQTDCLVRMALAKRRGALARVSLSGAWEYQLRAVCRPAPGQTFISWMPTGLFNGMAAPCLRYTVRGVIWYQGESNDSRPQTYAALLQGLIRDWRKQWRQERLPFIVAQLPNCGVDVAPDDAWPQIREAQCQAGQMEDVAVTVNLDAGEDNDLHPRDKKTVAHRAVCAARAMIYREDLEWKAPEVCGMKCEEDGKNRVRLRFDGRVILKLRPEGQDAPENPRLFELASDDEVWYSASAQADGEHVILQADEVPCPKYVRYAWFRAPGALLLYGENGFCVSPFRLCL